MQGTPGSRGGGNARRPPEARAARLGTSLVEISIVVTVLLFTFLAMSRSLGESMQLNGRNREDALAMDAAREIVEVLAGVPEFGTVFQLYDEDPENDPEGPGTAPGPHFAVAGLDPHPDDLDGLVGELDFPTAVGAGGRVELREDVDDPGLGMPRDLDGNGLVDAGVDQADDYRLLPVRVRLRWRGAGGERSLELRTLIADR